MSWWQEHFEIYRSPDRVSAQVRGKHLNAVTRLTPVAMAANALNGLIVCLALWNSASHAALSVWILVLLATASLATLSWWRRRTRPTSAASPAAIRRATMHAAWLASIWAVVPVAWFAGAGPSQRMLIAILTSGMMSAGAFALATVPTASLIYVAILTASAAWALIAGGEPTYAWSGALLAIYTGFIIAGVLSAARLFTARLASEREAERQGHMVGLLLRDFEEHAAEVLWEVDRDGGFTHVSHRFASLLGSAAGESPPASLLAMIEQCRLPVESDGGRTALLKALSTNRPFRDIVLPVRTHQGPRWWSITGKPVNGEDGHFDGWRGVIADVTGEKRAQQRLQQLALCDPLTGLANRTVLRDRLARFIGRGGANRRSGALLFIDLDQFKTINDTLGHSVGDAVLQVVAVRLESVVRGRDLLARLGGDEFAIVLCDAGGAEEVAAVAQRLLRELAVPCSAHGCQVTLGASVGIALLPEHGASVDEALSNADLALYAAKAAGRGRFEFFASSLGERPRRRLALEQELRQAEAREQLTLHWQPQIGLAAGSPVRAEALLRWTHPDLGAIAPAEFIPVAEDCGLIDALGRWVLQRACREAADLPAGMSISVNVSPSQLMRSDFVAGVEDALLATGLPPRQLEIEVTESILIDNVAAALENLRQLKQLGVRIALDDFGTGYSSLGYLLRFPFDTLKIDGEFVRELLSRSDTLAIARTIIALAATLGMETVAEGVETPAQLDLLRDAGCDSVQGYLLARPMPLGQLCALLDSWPTGMAVVH
jgi:diguanylate cyclase (GGDEF)-like protein